ncbi:response regulator transcription factor [Collinsella tanakaei]|uniref:response regulator transcription factor n=1 Tax=Collinsella tanakaei TaxID=626935 RepID=UPI001F2F9FDA|nr:response regulator [Collinsella tanakaei]
MGAVRVLLVEDDADINQIVATHLARHGMECTQAFSGSEARLLASGDVFPFDIVVSDLMLPGLNGEELVSLIRERDARVPIIVISAARRPPTASTCSSSGRTTTSPSRSTLTSSWCASRCSCGIAGLPARVAT